MLQFIHRTIIYLVVQNGKRIQKRQKNISIKLLHRLCICNCLCMTRNNYVGKWGNLGVIHILGKVEVKMILLKIMFVQIAVGVNHVRHIRYKIIIQSLEYSLENHYCSMKNVFIKKKMINVNSVRKHRFILYEMRNH